MTLEQVKKLSDDELRIEVAELRGDPIPEFNCDENNGCYDECLYHYHEVLKRDLPDYPQDLNAMHEAEKKFNNDEELWDIYLKNLWQLTEPGRHDLHTTARQRAEAFVLTMQDK